MSFPARKEILGGPTGFYLLKAFDYILDIMHIQPFRLGRRFLRQGSGTPEGVVLADRGDLFLRDDGDAQSTLYFKSTDGAYTGWIAAGSAVSTTTIITTTNTVITGVPLGLVDCARRAYLLN